MFDIMTKEQIKAKIEKGQRIECTKTEYEGGVRDRLQALAGHYIDSNQNIKAEHALNTVRDLDTKYR